MLAEIETAILNRLEPALAQSAVGLRPFPDNPKELGTPVPRGQIFVGYKGATFRKTNTQPVTLDMAAEFEITLQLTNLRSHTGAYPLLDLLRWLMTGFIPLAGPTTGFYPTREGFMDFNNATWLYSQTYAINLSIVAGLWGSLSDQPLYTPLPPIPSIPWEFNGVQTGIWRAKQIPTAALLDRVFGISD